MQKDINNIMADSGRIAHEQPQIHRTVAGTKAGRRLMAGANSDVIILDGLTSIGEYQKAERKGIPTGIPRATHNGHPIVLVSKETYKQIGKLRAGEKPHIGKKQIEKDKKRFAKMLAKHGHPQEHQLEEQILFGS